MTALATAELDDATAADDTVPDAVPAIIPGPTDMAVSLFQKGTWLSALIPFRSA